MHLYKAGFNHLTISIIGNSSKEIHQVICHWIGGHFYDAAPWNSTKSDWHLHSCLEDEEARKRKEVFWFHRDGATIVCVWASVSVTGHEMGAGWWASLRGGQENGSLTCHIFTKSTNAKFQWIRQEHIKISYFVWEQNASLHQGKPGWSTPAGHWLCCMSWKGNRAWGRGRERRGRVFSIKNSISPECTQGLHDI